MGLQIVPVLDVMAGQVVRGVAGERERYRPIESRLVGGSEPDDIARAFLQRGYQTLYFADLDAIRGAAPDVGLYRELIGLGTKLWVDAGTGTVDAARTVADCGVGGVIVGLESVGSPAALREITEAVPREQLMFSLDMKHGEVVAGGADWRGMSAVDCAIGALELGIERLIVLDVAAVGVGGGVTTLEICRKLRRMAPGAAIVSGGGVRGPADLVALEEAGCDAALVASALHDGLI